VQVDPVPMKWEGKGLPPQPKGPCGQEYHNLPRKLNTHASWTPAPKAVAYDVQIDCMDCRQAGKWDSEVGAPFQINQITATSIPASFEFWGDNRGRWRVRGEFPGASPRDQRPQPGPWSAWCDFSFKTGGQGGALAAPTPRGRCGQEYHNFPRELHMTWSAVPGASGYQVEIDCLHCKVVGKWDSQTPGGAAMISATTNSATFTFPGDNRGRWRVRATRTAAGPNISAIQAGPWSRWCAFSFKTGGTLGEPPRALPDITAGLVAGHTPAGVIFGGDIGGAGGKFFKWGSVADLTEGDSFLQSNGKCAFRVTYAMSNLGPVATSPAFLNRLYNDSTIVAINSALSLGAHETNHSITTEPYLSPGGHLLKLSLDDDHNVAESNEGNNTFSVRYRLEGKCTGGGSGGAGQPCGISLTSLSATSGMPGGTFEMIGTWGPTQGTKIPCINMGTMNKLEVVSWSNTVLKVRIPPGLPPGKYKVGVYCEPLQAGVSTYSSGWLDFEIVAPRILLKPR
jgi:hypothetical protein